jgi:NAD(P)-dependent dehydrogenase (short-subunit alcohol dehydrogenase family)/alkylhydroperoxidase family enzyme
MIKAEGGTALAHAFDATSEAECRRLVDAAVDRWGRLDFLDNNVGIGSRGSVVDEKPEEYRRVMQVNVETMFLLSKHAIPAMIKTAKGGAIVNISSISALRPRGLTTYTVSKAAVIGLTQAMAVDHGRDHIRVNCICPGPMYTPMVNARQRHERGQPRPARQRLGAQDRGHRLGHRPGRALPAERPRPLHHRPGAGGRRRRHAAGTGTRFSGSIELIASRSNLKVKRKHRRKRRWPACPISRPTRSPPEYRDMLKRNTNLHKLLVNSPDMARAFNGVGGYIRFKSKLDPRLRELAILQVGWMEKSEYEFTHHVKIGKEFGVTDEDIQGLMAETEGKPSKLEPLAKAILKGAREMVRELAMSDATFAEIKQELSNEHMTDLVLTIAFYCAVVRVLATMKMDNEPYYKEVLQQYPIPGVK